MSEQSTAQQTQNEQQAQSERAVQILAKNIYREFRSSGFSEREVMALAGELLALVTSDVRSQTRPGA